MALESLNEARQRAAEAAAPAGLEPTVVERQENGGLSALSGARERAGRLPGWQTGGRNGGTENGFQTDFYNRMYEQRDRYLESGNLRDWYEDEELTGVATWNQQSKRHGDVKFGDVFENGVKVGNLLDGSSGYSENEAYTLLGDLVLDSKTRSEIYQDTANPGRLKDEVTRAAESRQQEIDAWGTQQAYQSDVDALKGEWDDTATALAITGAGAAGGAATGAGAGAAIGALFAGVGAIPGAVVGGLIGGAIGGLGGGTAAALNRDQIEDVAARAAVQTGMAAEEFGAAGGLSTGLRSWGGAAVTAISPLSNTVQGLVDLASEGGPGDGSAAFYEEEQNGFLQALNVGATLGDSLLQFLSPTGRALFMGTMGAQVAGGLSSLVTQEGALFDDRSGTFDRPDDAGQWLAAVGSVGIDAVQLLGARGLTRATINRETGAVIENGIRRESIAGRTFDIDQTTGEVLRNRTNLTVLAPSEMVQWASARTQALFLARRTPGQAADATLSKSELDQYIYNAAVGLQDGTNLAKTALVNAFGEGTEEAVQAILEPLSHGWTPEFENIAQSYIYGAAAGAGMSIGLRAGATATDFGEFTRANISLQLQGQQQLTREQWKDMSDVEKQQLKVLTEVMNGTLGQAAAKIAKAQAQQVVETEVGLHRKIDAFAAQQARELENMNPSDEGTYTIAAHSAANIKGHVVMASLNTIEEMMAANLAGTLSKIEVAKTPEELALLQEVEVAQQALLRELRLRKSQYEAQSDADKRRKIIRDLNATLEAAWNSTLPEDAVNDRYSAASRAVGLTLTRDPQNSSGSYQLLLPQVNYAHTEQNGDRLLQISPAIAKGLGADFDGDKMRNRVGLYTATLPESYRELRLGLNMLGSSENNVTLGNRAYEVEELLKISREVSLGTNKTYVDAGKNTLRYLRSWLSSAFASIPGHTEYVDEFIRNVEYGREDAKQVFLQRLAGHSDLIVELGTRGLPNYFDPMSNVFLEVDRRIVMAFQQFQEMTAKQDESKINLDELPTAPVLSPGFVETEAIAAATVGQTVQQATVGTDPFRKVQKLHYGPWRSPSEWALDPMSEEMTALSAFYERINSDMQRSTSADAVSVHDRVSRDAIRALMAVEAEYGFNFGSSYQNIAAIATLRMPNFMRKPDGTYAVDGYEPISMAQFVLRRVADRMENEYIGNRDENPKLNEIIALRNMSPDEAIMRVFHTVPVGATLGEAGLTYAANLTWGQLLGDYRNRTMQSRQAYRDRVKSFKALYKQNSKPGFHDAPHDAEDFASGELNLFTAMSDAMFKAAADELTQNADGSVTGSMAKRDKSGEKKFQEALATIRETLKGLKRDLYNTRFGSGKLTTAELARILDEFPQMGRAIFNMITDAGMMVSFPVMPDGVSLKVPDWFLHMLTVSNAKEQSMIYFRHSLLDAVNALGADAKPRDAKDRLVRLVLELRADPPRLLQFQEKLYTMKDPEQFMRYVNRTFQHGTPQLIWHRDVAQFDRSETTGGWKRSLPGAELREALTTLSSAAASFQAYASKEVQQDASDSRISTRLLQELDKLQLSTDPDEILSNSTASNELKLFVRYLQMSADLRQGLGPSAMQLAPMAVALGLYGDATDKGKAAKYFSHLGNEAARGESPSQEIGYTQAESGLTSWDEGDVVRNPQVLHQDLRIMSEDGRTLEWKKLDVRRALEAFQDPELRPMVRAVMFPSVWEVGQDNTTLTQQTLTDTSLQSLLDGGTYLKALTGKSYKDDMILASLVDNMSDGTHPVMRLAADLVVARTSALKRTVGAEELQRMTEDVYRDLMGVIRAAVLSPANLQPMVKQALDNLKQHQLYGAAPSFMVDSMKQVFRAMTDPTTMINRDSSPEELARAQSLQQAVESYLNQTEFEDAISTFTIDWSASAADIRAKKKMLYSMLVNNPHYVEASGQGSALRLLRSLVRTDDADYIPVFSVDPTVDSSVTDPRLGKTLDEQTWERVGAEMFAVQMEQATSFVSTRLASTAAPKDFTRALLNEVTGNLQRDTLGKAKYWDQSYRYLVDDLLDPDSALMQAAMKVRNSILGDTAVAPRTDPQTGQAPDFLQAVMRMLDPEKLGPWTSELARQSIDGQNRIDASGVARQVAAAGIAYAQQQTIAAATKQTYLDPRSAGVQARQYSLTADTIRSLANGTAALGDGLLFGAGTDNERLALLNGRFAEKIVLRYIDSAGDEQTRDLLDGFQTMSAGKVFQGSTIARKVGLRSTSMDELAAAIRHALPADARDATIDLALFHPKDQPATPEFANNLFFEGSALPGAGHTFDSLLDALWFSNEGLNVTEQAAALEASKKGKLAWARMIAPTLAEAKQLEAGWESDYYEMLSKKAIAILDLNLGHGHIHPTHYNTILKDLKLRHAVKAIVDGKPVIYSSEQVIAAQQAGQQLPGEQLELVTISHRVLRTIMGEQNGQGVARAMTEVPSLDFSDVPAWTGDLQAAVEQRMPSMLEPALVGWRGLKETRITHRGYLRQLTVVPPLRRGEYEKYRSRWEAWERESNHIFEVRRQNDPNQQYRSNLMGTLDLLKADNQLMSDIVAFSSRAAGVPFTLPLASEPLADRDTLQQADAMLQETLKDYPYATGWVYADDEAYVTNLQQKNRTDGLLRGPDSLKDRAEGAATRSTIVRGDLVLVFLDSFTDSDPLVRLAKQTEAIRKLAARGATIALVNQKGDRDSRLVGLPDVLDAQGYEPVAGTRGLWKPIQVQRTYQTLEARASRLLETTLIERRENLAVNFISEMIIADENTAVINNVNRKDGRELAIVRDLAPLLPWDGFGRAWTAEGNALVKQRLQEIASDPKLVEHMLGLSDSVYSPKQLKKITRSKKERVAELQQAFQRAAENFAGNGLPRVGTEFGPGDIIPLIGPENHIVFYRHGHTPPESMEAMLEQLQQPLPGGRGSGGYALYGSERLSNATTHTGTIERWDPNIGYDFTLTERVPMQAIGNKTVFSQNGFKIIGISIDGTDIQLPEFGVLPGMEIDYLLGMADTLSKENYAGVVNNHRNAFGYLGMDHTPAMAQVFFGVSAEQWAALPERSADPDVKSRENYRTEIHALLESVHRSERKSVIQIQAMMEELHALTPEVIATLSALGTKAELGALGDLVDAATLTPVSWAPEHQITLAALLYMMAPTARPEHVMSTPGLGSNVDPQLRMQTFLPPALFTEVFDRAPLGSPLRKYINAELNKRLANEVATDGTRQTGYHLGEDWTFTVFNKAGSKDLTGWLQFAEGMTSGDNPAFAAESNARKDSEKVSLQYGIMSERAIKVPTLKAGEYEKLTKYVTREGVLDINSGRDLFTMMQGDVKKVTARRSMVLTPAQNLALAHGREVRRAFEQGIETGEWGSGEADRVAKRQQWNDARARIVAQLGLSEDYSYLVDSWVRRWAGAPKAKEPRTPAERGNIGFKRAMSAIKQIEANLANGKVPMDGSRMPFHSYSEMLMLHNASNSSLVQWKIDGREVRSLMDFLQLGIGMNTSKDTFDPRWKSVADAYVHTYREAGGDFLTLPLSVDELADLKLLDPQTNEIILSMDPETQSELVNPTVADLYNATLDDLFDGQIYSDANADYDMRFDSWSKKNDVPTPMKQSYADFRKYGAHYQVTSTHTNPVMRIITNLRAANGMFNPWLYVAAPLEMGVRNILEDAANLLQGQSTSALGAAAASATGGATSSYDVETLEYARKTYSALGQHPAFKSMLYNELVTIPKLSNAGRIEAFTAMMARAAGRWQDPTYGMHAGSMAQRYAEAAMRATMELGSLTTLTPRKVLQMLNRDPLSLQKNHPQIHRLATNSVANARSLKPTTASMMLKMVVDPLSHSRHWWINIPSHLMLKLPLMFAPYALNVATQMLGLQAVNQMTALLFQGRSVGKRGGKFMAALQGSSKDFDPKVHGVDWIGETTESVDLSSAFIRAGMTHTSLMGLGLMAGTLGLTGEDDEEARRRREAEVQGAGHIYDVRAIQNDFRNADALFLSNLPDWVPFADTLKEMFEVAGPDAPGGSESMVNLHWTMKMFLSPMMGINRFISTGDFRQVMWGFEDALGSMPLVNAGLWDDSAKMAAELYAASIESEASGNPESMGETFSFLMNSVMTLERMLFENAFVNSVYTALDKYDRDPWTLQDVNGDGMIQRNDLSQPMSTDALQPFLTDDGLTAEGFVTRDWWDGQLRTYSEGRATLAFFGSLFTGFGNQNSLWRYDMTVRQREVDRNALTGEEAAGLVLSLWDPQNEREELTFEGREAIVRGLRMGSLRADDPALQNVYLSFDQRKELTEYFMNELLQRGIDAGLDYAAAEKQMEEVWYGSRTNPYATPLQDIVWSKGDFEGSISYSPTLKYNQLNTTYVMGPDGKPWATGVGRGTLMNFFGPTLFERYNTGDQGNLGVDDRLNSVDETAGLNTGFRNLERVDDSWDNPTDEDILAAIEDGFKNVTDAIRVPSWSEYGSGYGRSGGRSGGGGGGGGGVYAYRVNSPVRNDPTYGRSTPYIRSDNPIIRRATLRRERFSSTRGRLNQWQ